MSRLSFHALKHAYRLRHRNLKRVQERLPTGYRIGPRGRIDYLRNSVTNLFRHERVEGTWDYLDETRGYAEILIQQSIKNGYDHEITKEMVDYWIVEKDIIPKLFEVLVPRYENYDSSFTSLHTLPYVYPGGPKKLGVLELKGNPWPPIKTPRREVSGSLTNILLDAAKKEFQDNFNRQYQQS